MISLDHGRVFSAAREQSLRYLGEAAAVAFAEHVSARNIWPDPNGFTRLREDGIAKDANDGFRAVASNDLRLGSRRLDNRYGESQSVITPHKMLGPDAIDGVGRHMFQAGRQRQSRPVLK